jgi:hypothetical protein
MFGCASSQPIFLNITFIVIIFLYPSNLITYFSIMFIKMLSIFGCESSPTHLFLKLSFFFLNIVFIVIMFLCYHFFSLILLL